MGSVIVCPYSADKWSLEGLPSTCRTRSTNLVWTSNSCIRKIKVPPFCLLIVEKGGILKRCFLQEILPNLKQIDLYYKSLCECFISQGLASPGCPVLSTKASTIATTIGKSPTSMAINMSTTIATFSATIASVSTT